ncbi:TldD/PmbA family protein [Lysinibacillus fusiformis]|uniref:TldD/PmbA family protein n=1 Tax=Lysinibacillus fusiformis TaxID=28031 RepID=UPI002D777CFF|nr:TldD/PmbA family protein [Lysinibacillus fusiformis]WRT00134.1 TldD/PmbA family protein [Lysinibacillus fusiformis]
MNIAKYQEKLLDQAQEAGFIEAEVYYEQNKSIKCMLYKGEIDSYETSEDGGLSLRGLYNGKMGYSYTEKLDDESIPFLINSSKANANILDEDEGIAIFDGSSEYPSYDYYNEKLETIGISEKIELLRSIEEKIRAYDSRIITLDYCFMEEFTAERSLVNSKNLALSHKENGFVIFLSTVVKEGEEMKTGSYLKMTRDFHSLQADAIAKEAAEEALANLGEKSIPGGKYPIILRSDASASLLETFMPILSAENAQKDQSLFKGKVGQKVASEAVTLLSTPFHPAALSGANFDGEGVATKEQEIILEGTLQTLLHNRKTAKKDNCETTGHAHKHSYKGALTIAPQNLYISTGEKTLDGLIHSVRNGVLITELSGLHSGTNTVSGDFSVAAKGFHIENGKIASPVKQMTIAGNFFEVLHDIKETSSELYFLPQGYGSSSLLVKELSVTVE